MFAASAWLQPTTHRKEPRPAHFDLRDRVKPYTSDKASASSQFPDEPSLSPTDCFFGGPRLSADQVTARKATTPVTRSQKLRQGGQREQAEKTQKQQEHRTSLGQLQASTSPIAKELVDRFVSNSDRIYDDALTNLSTIHKELASIIAEATNEDDRVLNLVHTNEKRVIKAPAETRITDDRTGEEMQVGLRVAAGKDHIDALEAEVASLWEQWETAQREVDDIKAELASAQAGSVVGAQEESLAAEMAKFEAELADILEEAHEDARASEKGFSKRVKGVMSALLQQYFLED